MSKKIWDCGTTTATAGTTVGTVASLKPSHAVPLAPAVALWACCHRTTTRSWPGLNSKGPEVLGPKPKPTSSKPCLLGPLILARVLHIQPKWLGYAHMRPGMLTADLASWAFPCLGPCPLCQPNRLGLYHNPSPNRSQPCDGLRAHPFQASPVRRHVPLRWFRPKTNGLCC